MLLIRPLEKKDYPEVRDIYEEGIQTKMATFEPTTPDWSLFDDKFLPHSRLIALKDEMICAWATLSAVSKRWVYRGVAEVSIYVSAETRGQRIGDTLLKALIDSSEAHAIWTLQAVIFAENAASVQLHQSNGFRLIGKRERIAQLDGHWKDTLLFERRSSIIGQ
jgi:phosphinothricin acetyltransferase